MPGPRRPHLDPRIWLSAGLAVLLVTVLLARWTLFRQPRDGASSMTLPDLPPTVATESTRPPRRNGAPAVDATAKISPMDITENFDLLWASPTSGTAIDLPAALPGAQFIVRLRLAELWQHPEFQKTVKLLGTPVELAIRQVQQGCGLAAEDIDQLTITAAALQDERVDWISHVVLRSGVTLPPTWTPSAQGQKDESHAATQYIEYQLPAAGNDSRLQAARIVLIANTPQAQLVIAPREQTWPDLRNEVGAVLLRSDLERLRAMSDQERQLTVIASTAFLMSHAKWLEPMLDSSTLGRSVVRDTTAVMLSAHWDRQEFYVEFAAAAPFEQQARLADRYQDWASSWCASQQADRNGWPEHIRQSPFGRRWPRMVEFFTERLRVTRLAEVTLANASLPIHASHNLFCGILLARRIQATHDEVVSRPRLPLDWSALLSQPVTYRFEQRPLDDAVAGLERLIREAVPGAEWVRLVVDGSSLEAAGITRNQQIRDFQANDLRLADVLQKLADLAQPARRARESGDLVWAREAADSNLQLWLTTRDRLRESTNLRGIEPDR